MYSKMRFRRRRKTARRFIRIGVIVVATLGVLIGGSLAIGTKTRQTGTPRPPAEGVSVAAENTLRSGMDEPRDASSQVNGKWYGLCVKNSIRTVEDLRRIVESDPILANHYADFDWSRAKVERLQNPAAVHVAYRKNEVIRYTTRQINLPRGEHYVTDGKRNIRLFCCNDFVDAPPRPQPKAGEAPETAMVASALRSPEPQPQSQPQSNPVLHSELTSSVASIHPRIGGPMPALAPFSYPPDGSKSNIVEIRKPPVDPPEYVVVPEPTTFLLVGSGMVGIWIMEMIRRRRK